MFSSPNGNQYQNVEGQRHCILVAASNPYPLPTPVYRPQPQNAEKSDSETQRDNGLSDAETLAKFFAQVLGKKVLSFLPSLSLIPFPFAQEYSSFAVCYLSLRYLSKAASTT